MNDRIKKMSVDLGRLKALEDENRRLREALEAIVAAFDKTKFDYEMADAMKDGLYEKARKALGGK